MADVEVPEFQAVKLGKKAAEFDPRTLKLADYIDRQSLPPIPTSTNYRAKIASWPMMQNDRIGDCGPASCGHQVQAWTTLDGENPFTPTDQQVVAMYSAVSGYDPRTGRNDDGVIALDLLKYFRSTGIAGHKIAAFASLHLKNHAEVMESIYLFDGVALGVLLPRAVQGQKIWKTPPYPPVGPWQPGSWGGHMIPAIDFSEQYVYVVSWGQIVPVEWGFLDTYADEIYCVFSWDFFGADQKAINGFNAQELANDLAQITGSLPPIPPPLPIPPVDPPVGDLVLTHQQLLQRLGVSSLTLKL